MASARRPVGKKATGDHRAEAVRAWFVSLHRSLVADSWAPPLIPAEVMEVVHDGAAQMPEDEPEHGLENFLGCWRHAGRVSQLGIPSRIIVNGMLFRLDPYRNMESYRAFQRRCGTRYVKPTNASQLVDVPVSP